MTIKAKLLLAFGVALVALITEGCIYQLSMARLVEARHWVEHTQIVMEHLENVMSLCKDLETGQRGFGLTRQDAFLTPYDQAASKLSPAIAQVRALTIDNPNQQRRLDKLEDLEAAELAFGQRVVETARIDGTKAAADLTATQRGMKLMDSIRALIAEMEDEEKMLLVKRTSEMDWLSNAISAGTIAGVLAVVALIAGGAVSVVTSFTRSVGGVQAGLDKIGAGDLDHRIQTSSNDEFSKLGVVFNDMAAKLKTYRDEAADHSWLNGGLARFGQMLQGETNMQDAAHKILGEFAQTLGTRHGMLYLLDTSNGNARFVLVAAYAHNERKNLAQTFDIGQGLIGQCAMEKQRIVLSNAPDDYIRITSGLGDAAPRNIAVVPVVFEGKVKAVIEQSSFEPFSEIQFSYLDLAALNLGIVINSIEQSQNTERMLRQEQTLTEELQSQQEELTEGNRRLEAMTKSLQASEEELRQQQEELQQTNEELEERSRIQARQNTELESKNLQLEELQLAMQEKAQQLSTSSRYKSEFLSNMSHELRTPLNSLLILSKLLYENTGGSMTQKQVEYARTIHAAGSDLLLLIDDVLDISKIEAGAMPIDVADHSLRDICNGLVNKLDALAKDRGLVLNLELEQHLPKFIKSDGRRLQQILKNLLANAIKFTEEGTVTLKVRSVKDGWKQSNKSLNNAEAVLAISVIDTGIGVPTDKQSIIFEAFRQADGTINRKFGGTGLGLAISRELARLLGGEINLQSEQGKGSTFTLFIPVEYKQSTDAHSQPEPEPVVAVDHSNGRNGDSETQVRQEEPCSPSNDDRGDIDSGDKVLLVVQQDAEISKQVMDLARARGFKVLSASHGKGAFSLAQRYKPDAITLDVTLPDKDGWIFLDRLKRDSTMRHIPVHVFSSQEQVSQAKRLGAISYSAKPPSQQGLIDMVNHLKSFVTRAERNLLIVEDNEIERKGIESLIEGNDVKIKSVATGKEALSALSEQKFDCMILDLGLPDMSGFDILDRIQKDPSLADMPIVVHTCRTLTAPEETQLRRNTGTIVVKGAKSDERLLDETTLFLHRVETNLSEQKRKMLEHLHLKDPLLSGRRILIVDDDMRHIFAVTSVLEQYGAHVLRAENGEECLEVVKKNPDIELILMDVMMPCMDGIEATRAIRKMEGFAKVPIITLTAKAMKEDREQCIAAGASDYLSKPVDSDQLLSLMRVWLY